MVIFGLDVSDFVAIVAVIVAVASLWITYSRNRKSEQIRIARDLMDDINDADRMYHNFRKKATYPSEGSIEEKRKWMEDILYILDHLLVGVRYFTNLVMQKEINNKGVLNYYKPYMLVVLGIMQYELSGIEEKTKSDPNLTTALAPDFPSLVADIVPKAPIIRRQLSFFMAVWSMIRPSWKMRVLRPYYKFLENEAALFLYRKEWNYHLFYEKY